MEEPIARKTSLVSLAIILIIFGLSIIAIYQAFNAFLRGDFGSGSYFAMIGVSTLALAFYMFVQSSRKAPQIIFEAPRVSTAIMCEKCGFKSIRDFQRGDYILKEETETCPKCSEKMVLASIYREVKEED